MAERKKSGAGGYQRPAIGQMEALSAQLLLANQQLEAVNEKLRRSEAARSEMLANLSHDLRAPLTALRSAVDYLQSQPGAPADERAAMLAVMDRRCATLEQMTKDLYLLVAMDLPGFKLRLAPLRLAPFLEEYFTMQQVNDAYAQRRLGCEVPPDFDGVVNADPERLVQVLDNLFSNALKFTRPGQSITLGCRCAASAAEFYVRDDGAGIPEDQLEAIFQRTYKLSAARTPHSEAAANGSGLGLSIVRGLVEKQGGRVWCESAPGKGSTFIVRLPALPV